MCFGLESSPHLIYEVSKVNHPLGAVKSPKHFSTNPHVCPTSPRRRGVEISSDRCIKLASLVKSAKCGVVRVRHDLLGG